MSVDFMSLVRSSRRREELIDWECPICGYRVSLSSRYRGKVVRCPQCGCRGRIEAAAGEQDENAAEGEFYEPAELVRCPYCRELIRRDALKCKHCGEIVDRELKLKRLREHAAYDEKLRRAQEGNTHARNALICGIIGLFCFGIILGPVAIVLGSKGLDYAKRYPEAGGSGSATAGIVLGIVDIISAIIGIALFAAARR